MTFADDILEIANGEPIIGIVIGEMGWGDYGSEHVPNYADCPKNKLLSWEEAKKWLDYEYDRGYGAPDCQAIYAWTANKVIATGQYDGATWVYSIPRNPTDCLPKM